MNQLLHHAVQKTAPGHKQDSFVFVSDSTLPVKPFVHVYARLTADENSAFCVFPQVTWAKEALPGIGGYQAAVKTHQWMVLSRSHAEQSLKTWEAHRHTSLIPTRFHLNSRGHLPYNEGCLDEFWHFEALFGTRNVSASPAAASSF